MANRLQSAGTDLDSLFQSYVSGDIIQTTTTNIQNGGTDISSRYAGRDNRAGNAASDVNITYGGTNINISELFNKSGATYIVFISGSVTYNGGAQTPTLTHDPTNTPTQATISSKTDAGTYSYSDFTITLPGNYLPGVHGGTFTINKKALTAFTVPSYYYDPYAQFWVVQVITISGGIANSTFDGMTIVAGINTTSPDLPVTLTGVFDGSGSFQYTFPNGGVVLFQNVGGQDGFIRLTTGLSLNYSGTFTARLRPIF